MKKIFYSFLLFILFFIYDDVYAVNKYNSINMDVYIDSSGTAHIKEIWDVSLDSDTELYKQFVDMGNADIQNFKVYDNGILYTNIGNWDIDASFENKAYKSGINYINNGLELCFGISNYGNHKYILEYDITNFVKGLNDADVLYWSFIKDVNINNAYIKIYADVPFEESLDVWGYGNYGGYAYVHDGYIEMSTNDVLTNDEHMTILVKFPKNMFETVNTKENKYFSDYLEMAEKGKVAYTEPLTKGDIILSIIFLITISFFIVAPMFCLLKYGSNITELFNWKFNIGEKKLPKRVPLYRDIPFNGDIYKFYFLANLYKLNDDKIDLVGGVLLKWMKDGKIDIIETQSSAPKKIRFKDDFVSDYEFEINLYNMLYEASKDGILEFGEFEDWGIKNSSRILSWFNDVIRYETDVLVANGQIEVKYVSNTEKYYIKTSLYEDAKIIKGLKKFLLKFSKIDSRNAIEVVNWEEYLIMAQILGIAYKVAKQFKKIYPDEIDDYTYDNILLIRNISFHGISVARNSAYERSSSYSAGGGGYSSGGGGGGASGGGSIGSR